MAENMRLTIGQASKLYNISMDTLRYYHKEGLLIPEVNEENKYRYYTLDDLDKLSLIIEAKRLDIPLKEIKEVIKSENIEEYKKLIEKQEVLINQKMIELKKIKKRLKENKKMLDSMLKFEKKLVIEECTDEIVFIGIDINNLMSRDVEKDFHYVFDESDLVEHYYMHYENINGKEIYEEGILYVKYKEKLKAYLDRSLLKYKIEIRDKGYYKAEWCGTEKEVEDIILKMGIENKAHEEAFVRFKYLIPNKKETTYLCEVIKIK